MFAKYIANKENYSEKNENFHASTLANGLISTETVFNRFRRVFAV
jgi:type IV secretory pathway component VirB8